MLYTIYKTSQPSTGRYYIGRHSTEDANDDYMGSGRWVTSIKDKSTLTKEILLLCETEEELIETETIMIREVIDDPLNMNWNDSGVGWSSSTNPSKRPEQRERFRKNNPSSRPEVREKISKTIREGYANGRVNPQKGIPRTEEQKKLQSEKMKGKPAWNKGVTGYNTKPQTDYQKRKAAEANQKEWLITFPDGHRETIVNLNQFCRDNNLTQSNMIHVSKGRWKSHKGFRCEKVI